VEVMHWRGRVKEGNYGVEYGRYNFYTKMNKEILNQLKQHKKGTKVE
jgi:hypothetical protein